MACMFRVLYLWLLVWWFAFLGDPFLVETPFVMVVPAAEMVFGIPAFCRIPPHPDRPSTGFIGASYYYPLCCLFHGVLSPLCEIRGAKNCVLPRPPCVCWYH
jgi:hypothetical protein